MEPFHWSCLAFIINRTEKESGVPLKPNFINVTLTTLSLKEKNTNVDELFQNMNSHHPNIKLTIETNPTRFLDTAFSKNLDGSVTKVFCKPRKLPAFWNSQIPKRYKRSNIRGDLHHAFKIASNFDAEVQTITLKYLEVGYPIGFTSKLVKRKSN